MKRNRLLALFTALVLVISTMLSSVSFAAEKSDVAGTEFEGVVGKLSAVGVMTGYTDGTFRPDGEITRAEFAAIAIRALGLGDAATVSAGNTKFSDVPYTHWAAGYINLATDRGIIKGYTDGTFKPEGKITNAEAITILVRLIGLGPVVDKQGTWPASYIAAANTNGILDDVNVASTVNATRGNAAKMLVNTLEADKWGAVGYKDDGTVEYGKTGDTLLSENLEIDSLEDVVLTDLDLDDKEIELDGDQYDYVGADVDKAALFLNTVDAWVNADDEVIYVVSTSDVVYDAIEFNIEDEEVKAVEADKDYDLNLDDDDDLDVIVYVNGEEVDEDDIEDLDGDKYDYAKLVLNEKNDVIAIDAYDWDDYIVVEEVDDDEVFGYGDELNVEDYTIVKDGVTISVDDLEEGDILFYNDDAEYADVYNNAASVGKMEEVFNSYFEVDDDEYDYYNPDNYGGKSAQYLNEDEEIDDFDKDAAAQMEDEEGEVTVFVDREGNAVFVTGDLGVSPTSTVGAILYEDADGYTDTRDREYLELKVVNEEGKKVTYDFNIDDLETVTVDNEEYEVEEIDATGITEHSYTGIDVTDEDDDVVSIALGTYLEEGDVIELTFDEDGDLVGLGVFNEDTKDLENGETGDKYLVSKRVSSNVPVFIVEEDINDFDDDDVTVELYGEMEDDIKLNDGTVYFDDNDALYVVVTDSDYDSTSKVDAVITQVRYEKDSSSKIERVKALVDGEEKTYYMDEAAKDNDVKEGAALTIEVYDANGKIKEFSTDKQIGYEELVSVDVRDREIVVDDTDNTTYELVSDGYIYDVTDPDDIEEMTLSELKDAKAGTTVAFLEDEEDSRYVKYVLVNTKGAKDSTDVDGLVTDVQSSYFVIDDDTAYFTTSQTVLRDAEGKILEVGKDLTGELDEGDQVEVEVEDDEVVEVKIIKTKEELAQEKAEETEVGLTTENMDTQIDGIDIDIDGSEIVVSVPENFDFSTVTQTPGVGGDADKIYVGVKVEAPIEGTLAAVYYNDDDTTNVADDDGSADSKGFVRLYIPVYQISTSEILEKESEMTFTFVYDNGVEVDKEVSYEVKIVDAE